MLQYCGCWQWRSCSMLSKFSLCVLQCKEPGITVHLQPPLHPQTRLLSCTVQPLQHMHMQEQLHTPMLPIWMHLLCKAFCDTSSHRSTPQLDLSM